MSQLEKTELKKPKTSHMKQVKFLKDHGQVKKGTERSYHVTTAEALSAHKIVEILKDTPVTVRTEGDLEVNDYKKTDTSKEK